MVDDKKSTTVVEEQYTSEQVLDFIKERLKILMTAKEYEVACENMETFMDAPLTDYGLDSLDIANLVMWCEDEFDAVIEYDVRYSDISINEIIKQSL